MNAAFEYSHSLSTPYGRIDCGNKPKYLLIDLDQEALIYDLTEDEKQEIASKRIMKQHKPAFEELAKN